MYWFFLLFFPFFLFSMTLEEKVGQILMVHFHGEEANADAKELIQEMHVGGFVYYPWANGLSSKEQVQKLSAGLQALSSHPLIIAVDQEGGRVCRLKEGFMPFPSAQEVAKTGDRAFAKELARKMGEEMKEVGITLNLAPVVDVNCNPKNPVIGNRSFADNPEVVIAFARAEIEGFHEAHLCTCLKHFPGHGDVAVDSHFDLPVVNKPKEVLEKVEFAPFKALASQADCVMTAHILFPTIDSEHCATLSKKVLQLLREEMGFEGVIIADSLVMQGVLNEAGSVDQAAILAFNAGCDLLLLGGKQLNQQYTLELSKEDIKRIHATLVQAVREGIISEERLDASVRRVSKLGACGHTVQQ